MGENSVRRRPGKVRRHLLNAKKVQALTKPGRYADGGNLYLQIRKLNGELYKSWNFRYATTDGKRHEMGLGALYELSLADARNLAGTCRAMLRDGRNPLLERRERQQANALLASRSVTFKICCASYIEAHAPSWTNAKHASQWTNSLKTYAAPTMGHLMVADIDTDHVLRVLEPIWNEKRETARRLRARIERVLSWAATRGYRSMTNPARWEGNLKNLLAVENKSQTVRHHPALPYREIHDFMAELRQHKSVSAGALELCILTATRTSEVLNATWAEFDLPRAEWAIPGLRMKTGMEHKVPLSDPALAVLKRFQGHDEKWVFPGLKGPLSNMAMLNLVKKHMGRQGITVHGFRSSFRDWAAEQSNFPNHVVEMALAHQIGNDVEKAYRRGDLYEKRQKLMDAWASFIDLEPGVVTTLRAQP